MRISDIAKKVLDDHTALMIRERKGNVLGEPREYDVKELFTGNKKGWQIIDAMTANAMCTVYSALSSDAHREKWDKIPLFKLIDFTWSCVK